MDTHVPSVEAHTLATLDDGIAVWTSRVPAGPGFTLSLEMAEDWVLACTWPPWYTCPLWAWLSRLRWPTDATDHAASEGCTHLELLVDFVGSTGVCPPLAISDPGGGQVPVDPRTLQGSLLPGTMRLWTQHLLDAARQLQALSGKRLLPDKRHKVFSLTPLGRREPMKGVRLKPQWREPHRLVNALTEVLQGGSSDALLLVARRYEGPVYPPSERLVQAWKAMPKAHRAQLARWCKQE